MGRHEIKFRRQQMTSRRMERHKNYQQILNQHRSRRRSRFVRLLVYIIAFLIFIIMIYWALNKMTSLKETEKAASRTEMVLKNLSPNLQTYGFIQNPKIESES